MDLMNKIVDDVCREQVSTHKKLVVDAFQKHFGISIYDVDLREIEHIRVEGDPIESYRYRGEKFLDIRTDICQDRKGFYFEIKFSYKV